MRRWDINSSIQTFSRVTVLVACVSGCVRPRPAVSTVPPNPGEACAPLRARVEGARRALAAGHLLRAHPVGGAIDSACPGESQELAALTLQAAASLGDAETVKRVSREPTAGAPPGLYSPDGSDEAIPSETDADNAYRRAVAAYLSGQWTLAGRLGLAVGAGGSSLAPEGFILAARSAERAGDSARAARMWARAHWVGCKGSSPCAVQPPREDLFGVTAHFGQLVPWSTEAYCSELIGSWTGIVNGTWHVTPTRSETDRDVAYLLREVPTRVLIERVKGPPDSAFMCFSPSGRHRLAAARSLRRHHGVAHPYLELWASEVGGTWAGPTDPKSPPDGRGARPDAGHALITNDGRIVLYGGPLTVIEPKHGRQKAIRLPKDVEVDRVNAGEGQLIVSFRSAHGTKGNRYGVIRYDMAAEKMVTVYESGAGSVVGGTPDNHGRIVIGTYDDRLVWVDGATGKVLGEIKSFPMAADGSVSGLLPSGGFVSAVEGGGLRLRAADLVAERVANVGLLWHGLDGGGRGDNLRAILEELPTGSSTRGFKAHRGWTASMSRVGYDTRTHLEAPAIAVKAEGRKMLRLVITADKEGAMVLDEDGRFEFIGRVSAGFRASASCGARPDIPQPFERAWPLEVCGAVLEEPGLTAAWLTALPYTPAAAPSAQPRASSATSR